MLVPMPLLNRHLEIRKSQLPGAGLGLFTRVAIERGQRITEYKGRLVLWNNIKQEDGVNGYILRVDRTWAINAKNYLSAFGRYANDAQGLSRQRGLNNNAEYVIDGRRCFIEAKRMIRKGEEILVGYGKDYWNLIRKLKKSGVIQRSPMR